MTIGSQQRIRKTEHLAKLPTAQQRVVRACRGATCSTKSQLLCPRHKSTSIAASSALAGGASSDTNAAPPHRTRQEGSATHVGALTNVVLGEDFAGLVRVAHIFERLGGVPPCFAEENLVAARVLPAWMRRDKSARGSRARE